MLDMLALDDRFTVIAAASDVTFWQAKLLPASPKNIKAAKRAAVEYEFLSKTNLNVDMKHYAVAVKVSDFNELVLMYSVLEKEYKGMRSLFKG